MKHKYNKKLIGITLLLFLSLVFASFKTATIEKLMMNMQSQSLHKGKVVNVEAELFFDAYTGQLITRYIEPAGQIMVTNSKGELAIYDESENTVSFRQGAEYSTETNMIQFFLQGKTQDLGLEDFGFQLMSTEFEDNLVVTEWFPPASLYGLFNRIKLVHEDFLPIYVAYYDAQRNLAKKVYYSEYESLGDVFLPGLITEFNYVGNDSIISRMRFSDIETNYQAQSPWFDFQIPEDATPNQ